MLNPDLKGGAEHCSTWRVAAGSRYFYFAVSTFCEMPLGIWIYFLFQFVAFGNDTRTLIA